MRACGLELGLPEKMVYRQPFPGPGLGVRCVGAITRQRLEAVRESDAILREEFEKAGLDKKVWQYFTVVPDFKSVGVKITQDASNTWSLSAPQHCRRYERHHRADRLGYSPKNNRPDLAEVENVNRVCYDMSPKPPATIEFE